MKANKESVVTVLTNLIWSDRVADVRSLKVLCGLFVIYCTT